jgi:hypothetical protein
MGLRQSPFGQALKSCAGSQLLFPKPRTCSLGFNGLGRNVEVVPNLAEHERLQFLHCAIFSRLINSFI